MRYCSNLKRSNTSLPSIVITGHGEVSIAVEAMKAGAIDFIEKPVRRDQLLASIERAMEIGRDFSALSAWRETARARIAALTPRERQIMDLVIIGHPNKNIAADLKVSQRTVENHRAAVMKKTAIEIAVGSGPPRHRRDLRRLPPTSIRAAETLIETPIGVFRSYRGGGGDLIVSRENPPHPATLKSSRWTIDGARP